MEKQWLSYAFVQILKLGKCSGTCRFCFRIRHSSGLHKHTTGFCGPRESSKYCSYNGANKEKLLGSSIDVTYTSEQQGELEKVSTYVGAHGCNSSQAEVLSDTTHDSIDTNSIKQLKFSNQPQMTQNIFKSLESPAGRCVRALLHRAYRNLKDNQLLSEEQSKVAQCLAPTRRKSSHVQETVSLPDHNHHVDCLDRVLPSQILQQSSILFGPGSTKNISRDSCSLTVKEHFNYLMYLKYQYPNPTQAKILSAMFPDPAQLVYSVVKLVMRADHGRAQRLVVTDHLKQRYWKAQLTLSWPKEVTVVGLHPEKDLAIFGSYLRMCDHLKNIGLIYENKAGVWVPMTSDKVMMMLEKLSKYGESSLGCSRGRGFKIILEQIKDKDCAREKVSYDQASSISKANTAAEDAENKPFGSYSQEKADAIICQEGSDYVQEGKDIWSSEAIAVCNNSTDASSQTAAENIENVSIPNSGVRHTSRPRWLCTIHVGWPFPFVVHAEGLSLPAAQIMGYMSVIYKLKLKQLLTDNNRELSSTEIEHIVLNSTKQRWQKNLLHLTYDKTKVDKFGADAKIFCDASVMGFGAFLTFASTQKVSWLSEEWDEHKVNACLHYCNQRYPSSLLGELYTLVTAVFTWKRKLHSQRLLCYSDNLTVVSIINSFASKPAKQDTFKDPINYLIHTLQSTCQEFSITLQAAWLGRCENQLADCLSRRDFITFQSAVPEAAIYKTKAKKLVIKGRSLL